MVIYVVLYTQCLRYNISSAWFLDITPGQKSNFLLFIPTVDDT